MLELKNIVFEVPTDNGAPKRIIDDLSLVIPRRPLHRHHGPQRAASPRSAKLIMGIETPTSGQIIFNGQDITCMPTRRTPSSASATASSSRPASGA